MYAPLNVLVGDGARRARRDLAVLEGIVEELLVAGRDQELRQPGALEEQDVPGPAAGIPYALLQATCPGFSPPDALPMQCSPKLEKE